MRSIFEELTDVGLLCLQNHSPGGFGHGRYHLSRRSDRRHHGGLVVLRFALKERAMTTEVMQTEAQRESQRESSVLPARSDVGRGLQWTPIIVGALIATALSSILITFAATVGLGVSSSSPT